MGDVAKKLTRMQYKPWITMGVLFLTVGFLVSFIPGVAESSWGRETTFQDLGIIMMISGACLISFGVILGLISKRLEGRSSNPTPHTH